jgi:fumarate hydratase class II
MPYIPVLNSRQALSSSEAQDMAREFGLIRSELDDIRTAVANLRALLVAATAVGAGYNTTNTDLTNTAVYPKKFTAT